MRYIKQTYGLLCNRMLVEIITPSVAFILALLRAGMSTNFGMIISTSIPMSSQYLYTMKVTLNYCNICSLDNMNNAMVVTVRHCVHRKSHQYQWCMLWGSCNYYQRTPPPPWVERDRYVKPSCPCEGVSKKTGSSPGTLVWNLRVFPNIPHCPNVIYRLNLQAL